MASKGPALVSGANSGIGLQLTLRLLREGWDVAALVRSEFPDDPELRQAREQGRLRVYRGDLANSGSLDAALQRIRAAEPRIEVLFNNAGVAPDGLARGQRGYDAAFEVNTLAPYIVTKALLPQLRAGTAKTVVNTSSGAAALVRSFSTELLLRPTAYAPFSGPYGRSKLALSLWTRAWAPSLEAEGIRLLSADPGPNHSAMNNPYRASGTPVWIRWIQRVINRHPRVGADRLHRAAFGSAPAGAFLSGDRPRRLAFADQGPAVLALVERLAAE